MSIVQSDRDFVFGAFTPMPWDREGRIKALYGKSFLFSARNAGCFNPARTPITKVKHIESIYDETYSNKDYLLAYAGGMYIAAGCDRNYNSYSSLYYYEIPNVVADPSQVNVEPKVRNYLNHGDKYFKVKELEVYLVE